MGKYELTIPFPPKELSPNKRLHWAVKSRVTKKYRSDCYLLAKMQKLTIDWGGDIHIFIDIYRPDRRYRDEDNIIASLKSGLDGIADALGVNDRRFRIHPFVRDDIFKGGKVVIKFCDVA